MQLGANGDVAATGGVAVDDSFIAAYDAAGGEIRPWHNLHEVAEAAVGVVDQFDQRVADLAGIVRWDAGGHADGNTDATVDKQIGEFCGQNRRFGGGFVVIGYKINCVAIEIGEHISGCGRHAGLGITHGCGRVTVDRTKIALRVDQRLTEIPILGQPDERAIGGLVAVGVVVTTCITDDLCAFSRLATRAKVQIVHGDENAPLRWL